jgi:hypothetical protein
VDTNIADVDQYKSLAKKFLSRFDKLPEPDVLKLEDAALDCFIGFQVDEHVHRSIQKFNI